MATLTVRPIGIRDLTGFRALQRIPLGLGDGGAPVGPMGAGVLASLPVTRRYWRGYIATASQGLRAAVEIQPEPRDYRWVVAALAAGPESVPEQSELLVDVWEALLIAAIRAAGASGAKRLHACAPLDGPALEALLRANFTIYAYQTTLAASGVGLGALNGTVIREQEPSDAWALQQLYQRATPQPVQFAEAFTTNHWDVGRRAAWRVRGFLVERDHQAVAYCRVTSRGHQHVVDVLALPGEAGLLRELVPQALARSGAGENDEVWVGVPDYHSEYISHLEAVGFAVTGRQARMVRYMAVPVRTSQARPLPLVPEVGERLSARLPSYSTTGTTPPADGVTSGTLTV